MLVESLELRSLSGNARSGRSAFSSIGKDGRATGCCSILQSTANCEVSI